MQLGLYTTLLHCLHHRNGSNFEVAFCTPACLTKAQCSKALTICAWHAAIATLASHCPLLQDTMTQGWESLQQVPGSNTISLQVERG